MKSAIAGTPVRIVGSKLSPTLCDDFWAALYPHLTQSGREWRQTRDESHAVSTVMLHYLAPEHRGVDPNALREEALSALSPMEAMAGAHAPLASALPHIAWPNSFCGSQLAFANVLNELVWSL